MPNLGQRFWDPDNAINSALFNALETTLFGAATLDHLGVGVSDAAPIVARVTSLINVQLGVLAAILPNAQGLFVVTNDDTVNPASIYPSPGTHFSGLTSIDPITIGGGSPYSLIFVRADADLWAVIGSGV